MKFSVSAVERGWPHLKSDLDRLRLTALKPDDDLAVAYDRSGNVLLKGLIYDASNKRQPAHLTITEGPGPGEWHRFHVTVEGPSVSGVSQRKKGKSSSLLGNHVYYEVGDYEVRTETVRVSATDKLYRLDEHNTRRETTAPERNEQVILTNVDTDVRAIITLFWHLDWLAD